MSLAKVSIPKLLGKKAIGVLKDFLGCPIPNTLDYHNSKTQPIRSFQGVYGSNFNETITFCDFKLKTFELNDWKIIPVLAQSADSVPERYLLPSNATLRPVPNHITGSVTVQ